MFDGFQAKQSKSRKKNNFHLPLQNKRHLQIQTRLKKNPNGRCHNPSLGLATKAKGCKVASQKSPRIISHDLGSARECEEIDPHTLKGTPTLGVEVPVDS